MVVSSRPVMAKRAVVNTANGTAVLAAVARVLRWPVEAETARLPAVELIQPPHGTTFALVNPRSSHL